MLCKSNNFIEDINEFNVLLKKVDSTLKCDRYIYKVSHKDLDWCFPTQSFSVSFIQVPEITPGFFTLNCHECAIILTKFPPLIYRIFFYTSNCKLSKGIMSMILGLIFLLFIGFMVGLFVEAWVFIQKQEYHAKLTE